ncbi:MAG: hypothetical protein RR065_03995, partial [Clostridia bacterium]
LTAKEKEGEAESIVKISHSKQIRKDIYEKYKRLRPHRCASLGRFLLLLFFRATRDIVIIDD